MELNIGFSVLISVYNNDKPEWLSEALRSIYHYQTLKPSEIVIVIDGPINEKLYAVIEKFSNEIGIVKRIALRRNMGLFFALNEGLKHCSNEIVARMDADDISLPYRFEVQIKKMLENPRIAVLGSYIEEYDEKMENIIGIRKVPVTYFDVIRFSKKRSPVNHVTAVLRKSIVLSVGGYPPIKNFEDYALWCNIIKNGYIICNIPEILVKVRGGVSLLKRRSGLEYLRKEIKLIKYLKEIEFYTYKDILLYSFPRLMTRLLPEKAIQFIYTNFLRN